MWVPLHNNNFRNFRRVTPYFPDYEPALSHRVRGAMGIGDMGLTLPISVGAGVASGISANVTAAAIESATAPSFWDQYGMPILGVAAQTVLASQGIATGVPGRRSPAGTARDAWAARVQQAGSDQAALLSLLVEGLQSNDKAILPTLRKAGQGFLAPFQLDVEISEAVAFLSPGVSLLRAQRDKILAAIAKASQIMSEQGAAPGAVAPSKPGVFSGGLPAIGAAAIAGFLLLKFLR